MLQNLFISIPGVGGSFCGLLNVHTSSNVQRKLDLVKTQTSARFSPASLTSLSRCIFACFRGLTPDWGPWV